MRSSVKALPLLAALVTAGPAPPARAADKIRPEREPVNVHIIGDSTVASYADKRAPLSGWGQMLHRYFDDSVTVLNHAVSGRSSKSFVDEGRWDQVKQVWKPGDWLLIQFGHNDQKQHDPKRFTEPRGSYQHYLRAYVEQSRAAGVHPILVTSVYRRRFRDGQLIDSLADYPPAMRELAGKLEVPLVDLHARSGELLSRLGSEKSKEIFLWLQPGESANYPDGKSDNSHFCQHGAHVLAGLVAAETKRLGLPLAGRLLFAGSASQTHESEDDTQKATRTP